jgi:valyl-tRNA synthetase
MPFLTESLWQLSPHVGDSIMTSNWPQMEETGKLAVDPVAENGFRGLQSLVRAVRNARAEYNVEAGKKIAAIIRVTSGAPGSSSAVLADLIEAERTAISLLARVDEPLLKVEVITPEQQGKLAAPAGCVHLVVEEGLEAFLPLSDMIDYEKEKQRLGKL